MDAATQQNATLSQESSAAAQRCIARPNSFWIRCRSSNYVRKPKSTHKKQRHLTVALSFSVLVSV
jgi:hypothetical protein